MTLEEAYQEAVRRIEKARVEGTEILDLGDLMSLASLDFPELRDAPFTSLVPPEMRDGQSLVDRRSALLTIAQQRGLMRVASRRWLRGPLLAPFGLLGSDQRKRRTDPMPPSPPSGSPDGNMQR